MLFKRAVALLLLLVSCERCNSDLARGGATPYVRCLEADVPAFPATLGTLTLVLAGRVLEVKGLPAEPRIAVFQGPGMATNLQHQATLASLAAQKPDLLLMLGGLTDEPTTGTATLSPIAQLGIPLVYLAGGRDAAGSFVRARDALPAPVRPHLLEVTTLTAVRMHGYLWLMVAGSAGGAEGIGHDSCGFNTSDLGPRLDAAKGAVSGTILGLVSWEIPFGVLGASGTGLPTLGSREIRDLRDALGDVAGLHAWPDAHVMRPLVGGTAGVGEDQPAGGLQLVVPRLVGPAHVRADGTRYPPGLAIVRLTRRGLVTETTR